jgi:hypothetical protein
MVPTYNRNQTSKNIFIFSLLAETIFIVLFALLFFPQTSITLPFVSTLGALLLIILIWALISSSTIDREIMDMKTQFNNTKLENMSCPDYFTRSDGNSCKNDYVTTNKKMRYEFLDPVTKKPLKDVDLRDMFGTDILNNICTNKLSENPITGIPWTSVKPLCGNIN